MKKIIILLLAFSLINSIFCITWKKNKEFSYCTLKSIAFGNNIFAAAGDDGTIKISSDGIEWKDIDSGVLDNLKQIKFFDNKFIIVGNNGVILVSHDGLNWQKKDSKTNADLYCISYDNKNYIIMGKETICYSENSEDWHVKKSEIKKRVNDIIRDDKQFICVGKDNLIMLSKDGFDWQQTANIINSPMNEVDFISLVWNGNQYIAIAPEAGGAFTFISKDGNNWECFKTNNGVITYIIWDGNNFIMSSGAAGRGYICFSKDGLNWEKRITTDYYLYSVMSNNNKYVAIGQGGTICISDDLYNWQEIKNGSGYDINDIVFAKNKLVIAGADSGNNKGRILTSENGLIWKEIYPKEAKTFTSIVYNGKFFLAVGWGSIYNSIDGYYWTAVDFNIKNDYFYKLYYYKKNFYTLSNTAIYSSKNGKDWQKFNAPEKNISSLAYNNKLNKFFITGYNWNEKTNQKGFIYYSDDLKSWKKINFNYLDRLYGIIYENNLLIAFGENIILTSPDGKEWKEIKTDYIITKIIYANNQFVGIGEDGVIITSANGYDWVKNDKKTNYLLTGITWDGTKFIAVGLGGTILEGTP